MYRTALVQLKECLRLLAEMRPVGIRPARVAEAVPRDLWNHVQVRGWHGEDLEVIVQLTRIRNALLDSVTRCCCLSRQFAVCMDI